MATITTRVQGASPKGSPLTNAEVDNNFISLNEAKYESGDSPTFGDITATKATVELLLDATNNGSGAHVSRLEVNSFPARGSHIYLTDNDGRLFGIARDYVSGSALTRVKFKVSDGTTEVNAFDVTQAGLMTINEDGADLDFRVESDTSTHALFVDAGNSVIGLGTASTVDPWTGYTPTSIGNMLMVGSTGASSTFTNFVHGGYYDGTSWLQRFTDVTVARYEMIGGAGGSVQNFYTAGNVTADTAVTFKHNLALSKGSSIFNEGGDDIDFRVESDANTHALFVDAGDNSVSIGTSTTHDDVPLTVDKAGTALKARIGVLSSANNGVDSLFRFQTKTVDGAQNLYGDIGLDATNEALIFNDPGYSSSSIGQRPMRLLSDGSLNVGGPILLGAGQESLDTDSSGSVSSADAVNYVKWANRTVTSTFNSGIALQAPWSAVSGTNWTNNKFRFHLWRSHSNDVLAAAVGSSSRSGDGDSFVLGNTNIASGAEVVTTGLAVDGRDMYLYGQYNLDLQAYNEVAVNDLSVNADFRVESDGDTHALFVDAGSNRVGIFNASPAAALDVGGSIRATNFHKTWTATVSKDTWSRLLAHSGGGVYGGSYLVSLKGTRNNVVYNMTAQVTYMHSYKCSITVLSAGIYSPWRLRAVIDSNGGGYLELFDNGSTAETSQGVVVTTITTDKDTGITPYTSFTDGTSIPSGYYERSFIDGSAKPVFATEHFAVNEASSVFNENSSDRDFRIETDTHAHALFVDASTSKIGLWNSAPTYGLDVLNTGRFQNTLYLGNSSTGAGDLQVFDTGNNTLQIAGVASNSFRMDMVGTSAVGNLEIRDLQLNLNAGTATSGVAMTIGVNDTVTKHLIFDEAPGEYDQGAYGARIGYDADQNYLFLGRTNGTASAVDRALKLSRDTGALTIGGADTGTGIHHSYGLRSYKHIDLNGADLLFNAGDAKIAELGSGTYGFNFLAYNAGDGAMRTKLVIDDARDAPAIGYHRGQSTWYQAQGPWALRGGKWNRVAYIDHRRAYELIIGTHGGWFGPGHICMHMSINYSGAAFGLQTISSYNNYVAQVRFTCASNGSGGGYLDIFISSSYNENGPSFHIRPLDGGGYTFVASQTLDPSTLTYTQTTNV